MTVYAISVSVNFLVSLSLLAGVKLEKRWLLVPWISWNTLSLTVSQMAVFYAPNKVCIFTSRYRRDNVMWKAIFSPVTGHQHQR